MAKKINFALKLKDDADARTLDELKEHFDLEKIIGYFQEGTLLTWLKGRYYEDEAKQIEVLDKTSDNISAELCRILGVEVEESALDSLDAESIKVRNERIARLKQYPDGINVIDHVDGVAFNQKELNNLLDNGVSEIYLCNGKFTIPIKQKNKKYIGIGKVEVAIKSKKAVDFGELGISFVNVKIDEKFALPTTPTADALLELANEAAAQEDYARAEDYWKKAAEIGNSDAMYALGNMYREGVGVKKNDKQAAEWFKQAIKNDNTSAMFKLGEMYANGEGVRKNRQQAIKLFERAASMGNSDAAYKFGYMYYKGEGVTQDFKKAKELFQKAADNESANAMLFLGDMYMLGRGVRKNLQHAIEYYEKSAAKNQPYAMERLGLLYKCNETVQDYEKAMEWFKKAAEQGLASASHNIGDMYNKGLGVRKNKKQAVQWFRKAAEAGDADAMLNLGYAYYMGEGIEEDEQEGIHWIQKSADAGNEDAVQFLKNLEEEKAKENKSSGLLSSLISGLFGF